MSWVWSSNFIKLYKIVNIFRGTLGTTCAPAARCRVLRRGSWGPFTDPARSGGRGTRQIRVRAWPISLKTFVNFSFWAVTAGRSTPIRGPRRPAQGHGRLVAGVEHSSASGQIFFGARIANSAQNRFGSYLVCALDLLPTVFWYTGGQEGARACSPRHGAPTGHRWRL